MLCALRRRSTRHGSHEHPGTAYSWTTRWASAAFGTRDAPKSDVSFITYDVCPYTLARFSAAERARCTRPEGAEALGLIRKRTSLACIQAPWLQVLQFQCNGKHHHATVDGAVCAKAATYDPLLCELWALTLRDAYNREDNNLAFEDLNTCPPNVAGACLLYTSPSPRDQRGPRMPSSA